MPTIKLSKISQEKKPNRQYSHLYRLLKLLSHRARKYQCLLQAKVGEGITGGGEEEILTGGTKFHLDRGMSPPCLLDSAIAPVATEPAAWLRLQYIFQNSYNSGS